MMTLHSWGLSALVLSLSTTAFAAVPLQLPTQGVLRDNAGLPVLQGAF